MALATACEIENAPPPRVAVAPTATPEPAITPAPEPASEPTPTLAPTATPDPDFESTPYRTPHREYTLAPAGSAVVTDNGLALTITSFTPDAESVLANENPDYEPLYEDQRRLIIARLRVQNVGGDTDNPIRIDGILDRFHLIDSSSVTLGGMAETFGSMSCGRFPDNLLERYASLFLGGTAEGNLCFEIEGPKSETEDIVLMYDARDGYGNQRFLALANPDSVEPARSVDARLESQPGQAAGRSRANPVPPGRYVESADGLMALTIASANMSADFSALMAESPSDNQLSEGNRLVAARVRVQNVGGDGDSALFVARWSNFSIVGSSAIEFFERGCSEAFEDAALFLGEIAEINVCFEVPESETDLVLIHTSLLDLLYAKPSEFLAPQLADPRRWLAFGNPDTVEAARVVDASSPSP